MTIGNYIFFFLFIKTYIFMPHREEMKKTFFKLANMKISEGFLFTLQQNIFWRFAFLWQ